MSKSNGASQPFEGFGSPNYTGVPDEFFDQLLPDLSDAELRVLLYIMRRTFGFKRESDNISLSQLVSGITTTDGRVLDRGAGLSKSAAAKAVKSLAEKGIILSSRNRSAERGDEPTTYSLRFRETPVSTRKTRGGSPPNGQARVHQEDTQYTGIQKTDVSLSNIRKTHAKRLDGPEEKGSTPNSSVRDQSVSYPITSLTAAADSAQDAVTASGEVEVPQKHSEPLSEQTAILAAPMTRSEPSESRPGTEGPGLRRLREQAAKLRTELEQSPALTKDKATTPPPAERRQSSSVTALADLLPAPSRRLRGSRDERDLVTAYLQDFRPFLGDEAPLPSSVTRAINIFKSASVPDQRWADLLCEANSITKENTQKIRKKPGETATGFAAKNRTPYYFAVLEDLCGLRDQPKPTVSGTP